MDNLGVVLAYVALLSGCGKSLPINPAEAGAAGAGGCDDVGGPIAGMPAASFDSDIERFVFDTAPYDAPVTNLADPASGTTPPPSLSYDGAEGSPNPGSLKIIAPFSGANQSLVAYHYFGCGALHDWTGKILRARIKIADGVFTAGALLYVATSTTCATFDFGYAASATLARTSCWQDLRLDLRTPGSPTAGYAPASVVDFGVQFYTGSAGAGARPVTFLIDSFSVE